MASSELEVTPPMVVDLGKQRRSRIKDLKRGRGKLMDDVHNVVDRVVAEFGDQANGKQFIPVVIVFRKKSRRRRKAALRLPLPFGF